MLALSAATVAVVAAASCSFTVDTKHSFQDAQHHLRAALTANGGVLAADHVICIQPGRYDVSRVPLAFSAPDSAAGPGRVVWRATSPGVDVSGGVAVTGWEPTTLGGGSVYVAQVPAGFAPGAVVRQLWVGGARASRTVVDASSVLGTATPWQAPDGLSAGFVFGHIPASWSINRWVTRRGGQAHR